MRITIAAARTLLEDVMQAGGQGRGDSAAIADHLLDAELRGLRQGGLARAISIRERLARTAAPPATLRVEHETACRRASPAATSSVTWSRASATELAVRKARAAGIAMVAANDTWYTGMLSYYAEMAVAQDLVVMIASNASAWVAPHGASEGRFGTNPICFGFPSRDGPVIWDIGTSGIIHADALLARRLGQPLPEGSPTTPQAGRRPILPPRSAARSSTGAGPGARASGWSCSCSDHGGIDDDSARARRLRLPDRCDRPGGPGARRELRARAAEYAQWLRSARPLDADAPVRLPFERSARDRAERRQAGWIEVPEAIHAQLLALAAAPGVTALNPPSRHPNHTTDDEARP